MQVKSEKNNVLKIKKNNLDTLYIVMPAYNEEYIISIVAKSWHKLLEYAGVNSRLVIADGGSTDNTNKIILELQKELPRLEILNTSSKQHGPKLISLYNYAIKNGADYIFQTDSDGQTNPSEFVEFWKARNYYDAIFGDRRNRGDGKIRYIVERCVCIILFIIFRVRINDANAPFRLYKANVLKRYIRLFDSDYNLPNIMLTTFYAYNNENYVFKEITFTNRKTGKNSINLYKICKIGLAAIIDFMKYKRVLTSTEGESMYGIKD